jgi:hypothetical protein
MLSKFYRVLTFALKDMKKTKSKQYKPNNESIGMRANLPYA